MSYRDTAHLEFLMPVARERVAYYRQEIKTHMDRYVGREWDMMEWSDAMFKAAAHLKMHQALLECFERHDAKRGTDDCKIVWSRQDVKDAIWEQFKYTRAAPSSTSGSSNLFEQNLLQAVMDTCFGPFSLSWFHDAQMRDPAYLEQVKVAAAIRQAERDAQAAADAAAKKQAKSDARKARRAAQA